MPGNSDLTGEQLANGFAVKQYSDETFTTEAADGNYFTFTTSPSRVVTIYQLDEEGNRNELAAGKANGTDAYAGTPIDGKVVTDTSVGNVCKHAESGDVDIAFVYTSDVERFGGVKVVGTVPGDTHKNITYPGAVCAQSTNADAAEAFLDWCLSDKDAQEIWQKWGFELA